MYEENRSKLPFCRTTSISSPECISHDALIDCTTCNDQCQLQPQVTRMKENTLSLILYNVKSYT